MTRLGETMIDLAWALSDRMTKEGHTTLEDSRIIVDRIQKAAGEFELLNLDFNGQHDYLEEVSKWGEKLYLQLLEEELIGLDCAEPRLGWDDLKVGDECWIRCKVVDSRLHVVELPDASVHAGGWHVSDFNVATLRLRRARS